MVLGLLTIAWGNTALADTLGPAWDLQQPTGQLLNPPMGLDIRVNAVDQDGVDGSSVIMTVDGSPVVASVVYGANGQGQPDQGLAMVSYRWASSSYGSHTVIVSARDLLGNPSSTTWSFTVSDLGPPVLTLISPQEDFSTLDLQPKFSVKVADPDGNLDWNTAVVSLNGKNMTGWRTSTEEMYNYRNRSGDIINFRPNNLLDNDSVVTLRVYITDQAGGVTSSQWSFGVSTYRDMHIGAANSFYRFNEWELIGANNKACTSCHQDDAVLQQNHSRCGNCHGNNLYPPRSTILTKNSNACVNCHYGQTFTNGYAHNNAMKDGTVKRPPNHSATNLAVKHSSIPGETCLSCHSAVISREHARRQDSAGKELRCVTCHNSTARPEVLQAISAGDTNCSGCHTGVTHEQKHVSSLDNRCQNCHKASLSEEHLKNTVTQTQVLTCDTCHNNPDPRVGQALAWGSKYCGSCHTSGHNLSIGDKVPADIPLMEGYLWSNPRPLSLWKGESWVPRDYLPGGKIVISNRRTGVAAEQVLIYYKNNMTANGWTMTSSEPALDSKNFQLTFTKDNKKSIIWFYAGANHQAAPEVAAGPRIEVIYTANSQNKPLGTDSYPAPPIPTPVNYDVPAGESYPLGTRINAPLRWNGVIVPDGHEAQYQVQVSTSADFSSTYHLSGWMSLSYMRSGWSGVPVDVGGTYYWRVRARDAVHWPDGAVSGWSPADSFAVPGYDPDDYWDPWW